MTKSIEKSRGARQKSYLHTIHFGSELATNSKRVVQFLEKLKGIFVEYMKTDSEIPGSIKRPPDFTVSINFFAGGVVNPYQIWFRDETDCSLKEIAPVVSKIIKNTSSSSFDMSERHH
jgi:hypothetical protein